MPFPTTLSINIAHGVVTLDEPLPRRPDVDDLFIAAAANEFPVQGSRQLLPREAPLNIPHLIVQSTSSQVALSALQVDFEVRFYGDYPTDSNRCHEYIERKMTALLEALVAAGARPVLAGMVLTMNLSFQGQDDIDPVSYMLDHHVHAGAPRDATERCADTNLGSASPITTS